MKHGFVVRTAASVVTLLLAVSGCSSSADVPVVSAADLQRGLVDRLAETDTPSTWVHCPKDLAGTVGAVTRCDVTFSQDNTVTAVLTTTQVSGKDIRWEITQSDLTNDQLARRVARLTSAQSATCDSGLKGHVGEWALCQIAKSGTKVGETVEVKGVLGLALDLAITPMIPVAELEESVLTRVTPNYGRRPDRAQCSGGLAGTLDETVKCVVTVGDNRDTYLARTTNVSGGVVEFQVTKPPSERRSVDRCPGCPG